VSSAVLLDTHAWAWSFADPDRLSPAARAAVASAAAVYVSPISFFEIGQKARSGRWPGIERHLTRLPEILRDQGGVSAPVTPEICLLAATMPWEHRDPFDRLLAATGETMAIPLVTRDPAFAARRELRCLW